MLCCTGENVDLSAHTPLGQFNRSIVSDSLRPHGLQYARLPCASPPPRACSNSCPLSQWCHLSISSSDVPFSSYLQSFPASGSFPVICKEIQPVHPKGNQSWIFIVKTDAEAEISMLWPPDAKNWLTPLAQELGTARKGIDKQGKREKPMTFLQVVKVFLGIIITHEQVAFSYSSADHYYHYVTQLGNVLNSQNGVVCINGK